MTAHATVGEEESVLVIRVWVAKEFNRLSLFLINCSTDNKVDKKTSRVHARFPSTSAAKAGRDASGALWNSSVSRRKIRVEWKLSARTMFVETLHLDQ